MRVQWKLLGGAGIGIGIALFIVGHSRPSHGDPVQSPTSTSSAPPIVAHDPLTPYDLGPHAIPYDQLSTNEKAGVDSIHERIELGQPPSSFAVFSSGTAAATADAQAQIAARAVGLVDTLQDGVVP